MLTAGSRHPTSNNHPSPLGCSQAARDPVLVIRSYGTERLLLIKAVDRASQSRALHLPCSHCRGSRLRTGLQCCTPIGDQHPAPVATKYGPEEFLEVKSMIGALPAEELVTT